MPGCDEEWERIMDANYEHSLLMAAKVIIPENAPKQKEQEPNITIINCENCKYDKCEFYNKSGNSWCPRCKGLNYHK
tara:strand:+ start:2967 stop:3197 length:231 start_codon:yes stop_codon:yes gene_type:complete